MHLLQTVHKKKRETDRCQSLLEKLTKELQQRKEHKTRIDSWLSTHKQNWFQVKCLRRLEVVIRFMQMCIYPRVFFTTTDAVFAAKFILVLHQKAFLRFSTLICLDQIFNDLTLPVSMCTEAESHRYGRFLCTILNFVMRWHASSEVYAQECSKYPGFVTAIQDSDKLSYEDYRHVVYKWHYRITKSVVACLESCNYVQIRNGLIVLTRIAPHYPKLVNFGNAVERRLSKLKTEDKRPDIKALALSCMGMLKPHKADWRAEDKFHNISQRQQMKSDDAPVEANPTNTNSAPANSPVVEVMQIKKAEPTVRKVVKDKAEEPVPAKKRKPSVENAIEDVVEVSSRY
ncbi:THO complex subunit 2 [Cichlidogyrus casuarinus]|uniref:THO complex subunit 2 n=1 Tax=Cichlidogyrus casuarinus TaxID=1844966 RepID=A0ABD2QJI1_9PLAT